MNYQTSAEQKVSFRYESIDSIFAILTVVVGFLFSKALPVDQNPLGTLIMIFILFAVGTVYLKLSHKQIKIKSWIFTALTLVLSSGLITTSNKTLKGFLFLFILCCFLYWVYTAFGLSKILGNMSAVHILKAIFYVPVSYIGNVFPAMFAKRGGENSEKARKNFLYVLIGLAITIIPTSLVVSLLSFDSGFVSILQSIIKFDIEDVIYFIGDLILGVFFAMILFGSLFGSKETSVNNKTVGDREKISFNLVPKTIICTAVTPILLLYVIFFISQWDYYVSAFTKVLPENLSYSEYAREGFFQLCFICAFNAFMLLMFHVLVKTNGKKYDAVKMIYSSLISIFTLVLVATALSKMLLYIDSYGLTRLRVYSSWMIILLGVFFVITLIYQFIPKLPIISSLVVTFVIFFGLLTIPDVDAVIANYNVNAYIEGKHKSVDVYTLETYGTSAVPALYELKDHFENDPDIKNSEERTLKHINVSLDVIKEQTESKNIFSFDIPKYKAKKLFKVHGEVDLNE